MKKLTLSLFILVISISNVFAQESSNKLDFKQEFKAFMLVGVQGGGDGTKPLPLYYRGDGLYYSDIPYTLAGPWFGVPSDLPQHWEDDVEAGGLISFAVGVEVPVAEKLVFSAAWGYLYDEVYGDLTDGSGGKGSFKYSRQTIDLMLFYNRGRHRVGLGGAYHLKPKAYHHEYASAFDLKTTYYFDDGIGAAIQYDYKVSKNTSLGIKYTKMSYDFDGLKTRYRVGRNVSNNLIDCESNCGELVDADSLAINLIYRF
ncbi:hypothetical protein [Aliikangiella maris]|uniref:Uncharacterized protein n=2 Tax=Aliikangiella maris TaxID=3162458 RepID=A0ABV3MI74_9GAMM